MDLQAIRQHAEILLRTDGGRGHGAVLLGLVDNAERAHFEEVTALRLALDAFVDDYPCRFDHDGYCHTHGSEKPCRVATAKALLTRPLTSEWMRLWETASAAFLAYERWNDYGQPRTERDALYDAMGELGRALAEHKAKWAP